MPIQNCKKKKRILENEDRLRYFWDNIKRNNSLIPRVLEGEEREQGLEKPIWRNNDWNFLNLEK